MADQVTLLDLNFGTSEAEKGLDALIAKSIALAKTKKDLQAAYATEQKAMQTLNQNYADGLVSQEKYEAAAKKSQQAQIEIQKALLDTTKAQQQNNAEVKSTKTLLDSQATSVNALRAQLALNTAELNKMSEAERTTSEAGINLSESTKALSDKLKTLESSIGDNRRNVGNYAEGVKKGILQTNGLTGATGAMVGGLKSSIGGVQAFNAALKANPIMLVVSVILLLMSTIEKLMNRNTELSTSLKAAFAPFKVIFERLLDWITGLFKGVAWVLENISKGVVWLLDNLGLISEETKKAATAAAQLEKETQRIYQAETDALVPMAQMRREMEELKNIAADQTRSAKERQDALQAAQAKLQEIKKSELGILEAKYKQIKAQNSLSYTSAEDARKEQEALAALDEAKAKYATQEKEMIGQVSGIEMQEQAKRAAAAKAAADAKKKAEEDRIKAIADAEKKAADERKAQQDLILKQYREAVTALQLDIAEKEVAGGQSTLEEQKRVIDERLAMEKYRRDQNLIGEQEYNNNVRAINLEFAQMVADDNAARAEKEKNRKALDLENQRMLNDALATNDLESQLARLDAQKAAEIANAEAIGAETAAIEQRYDILKEERKKEYYNAQLNMASQTASQLVNLLGQESAAGKAFAVAQATINTYLGASKAIADGGFWGIAQAAIVIAAGLKQVMSIVKTKEPDTKISTNTQKFAKGGQIYGASHSQGGVTFTGDNGQRFEAEGGENVYILNKKASGAINALSALNMEYGGRSFGSSGVYRYANGGKIQVTGNGSVSFPTDVTLSDNSLMKLASIMYDSVAAIPNPQVAVTDINAENEQYNSVIVAAGV
jgi:hypothetical protein